jgi:hypothetical protein
VDIASVDGVLLPLAEARIPVTDDGLLRGDGVFEVMRLYDGVAFARENHLARMARSAENLRLALDIDEIARDVDALLARAKPGDGLLRIAATRGGHRVALIGPLPPMPRALTLGCVTFAPVRVLDGVKSLSYAANMLATRLARERGFDEALLVTPHSHVLELPTASFFWVVDSELRTLWGAKTRSGFGTRRSPALPQSIVACSAGDPWTARKRRFRAASRGANTRRQRPRSNKGTPQASRARWHRRYDAGRNRRRSGWVRALAPRKLPSNPHLSAESSHPQRVRSRRSVCQGPGPCPASEP